MNRFQYLTCPPIHYFPTLGHVYTDTKSRMYMLKSITREYANTEDQYVFETLFFEEDFFRVNQRVFSIKDVRKKLKFKGSVGGKLFREKVTGQYYTATYDVFEQGCFVKFRVVGNGHDKYVDVNEFWELYEQV